MNKSKAEIELHSIGESVLSTELVNMDSENVVSIVLEIVLD
jgi:hypothetical protein